MGFHLKASCISACLILCLSAGAQPRGAPDKPNVILITIDTLRSDYLGCYGNRKIETPTLDGLANDGTLFERAYCQAPMTPPSHASILTGTYPPTHGVRDFTSGRLRAGFPTLATMLKKNGYATAAFVSAYVLDSVWGLNQGFDLYYDRFTPREFQGVNPGNVQRKAGETIGLVLDWLNRGVRKPYFLWVHLYDPHHDYNPPEPFHSRYASDLYGGEVAYADHELGRLIRALKQRGDYDSSLIVATSDHGEAFGEHGEYEHGFFVYSATTHIPLIVKPPSLTGKTVRRVPDLVTTVDIAPTVLQVTQTPADTRVPMQGESLLNRILGKASAPEFSYSETLYPRDTFGWSDLFSYMEGNYKYIEAPHPELYNLSTDPQEKVNLLDKQKATASSLRQKLDRLKQRLKPPGNAGNDAVRDSQKIEALRSLGYVGVSVPARRNARGVLADPKDKIQVFNKVLLALQASDAGALAKSNALLTDVIREDPGLFIAHYSLGVNRLKAGEYQQALSDLDRALLLNPAFDLTEMNRANALSHLGKMDEAIAILQKLLRENPSRLEARRQLALMYSREKDFAHAIETYSQILSDRPGDPQASKFLGIAQVEAGQYEAGSATLQKAIENGADDAMVHNFMGIAQANSGQLDNAIASYRKALTIKNDYQQARLNLTFSLLKAGKNDEARKEFTILCRTDPQLCSRYKKYFP
jgi:arylsulfatase A-like enzyme/Flp pilus assembly protein TadD